MNQKKYARARPDSNQGLRLGLPPQPLDRPGLPMRALKAKDYLSWEGWIGK